MAFRERVDGCVIDTGHDVNDGGLLAERRRQVGRQSIDRHRHGIHLLGSKRGCDRGDIGAVGGLAHDEPDDVVTLSEVFVVGENAFEHRALSVAVYRGVLAGGVCRECEHCHTMEAALAADDDGSFG